jgi:DNA repair exonuclease SbcCD ATPase subunit
MYLFFEKMRYKNLCATGDVWMEWDFTKSGSTLIIGKNGSGKSTILDALCFVLFGKPYRDINKPTLINWSNGKSCEVEIWFTAGPDHYHIRRGMKPTLFEIYCNDKLVDQTAASRDYQTILEETVLRMNMKTFTQIVILGKATFVPFMKLKAADRRVVTETVLGIQIISTMSVVVKKQLDDLKKRSDELKLILSNQEAMRDTLLESLKEAKQDIGLKIADFESQIKTHEDVLTKYNSQITQYTDRQNIIATKRMNINDRFNQYNTIKSLSTKISEKKKIIENEIVFFHNNDSCPVCQQVIAEAHKAEMIIEREPKLEKLEQGKKDIAVKVQNIEDAIAADNQLLLEMSDNNTKLIQLRAGVSNAQEFINRKKHEINTLKYNDNFVGNTEIRLEATNVAISGTTAEKAVISKKLVDYQVAADILKDDGYKAQIIKKYIPIINQSITKYLQAMNFYASFQLNEEFDETIKSQYINDSKYGNFSEGEKQRIDMGLLFAWRAVAKIKGSVDTNLLIMDEIFDSSMDGDGMEDLFGIFKTFNENTNLFVISHRGDQLLDKFKRTIRFEKIKGFTQTSEE